MYDVPPSKHGCGATPWLPRRTAADVIASIEAELERAGSGVIAADADGTLWDGDVGVDLFEALLAANGVRDDAKPALVREAQAIGLYVEGSATAIAAALYAEHRAGRYANDRAFAMMAWSFAGWHTSDVDAFAHRVLGEHRIEGRVRLAMMTILTWAAGRGIPVYVVSASPIGIVVPAARSIGLERVVAMAPAIRADGMLMPELAGPIVYGDGKVHALELAKPGAPLIAAFGNSAYDAALLRAARIGVAVTPDEKLLEAASSIPGVVELEL